MRVDLQARKHVADRGGIVDAPAVAELCAEQRRRKKPRPSRGRAPPARRAPPAGCFGEKDRGGGTAHQVRAQPLEVAPHMPALRRIEIERRGGPALRLEDRPEQERAKAHPHVGVCGQRPDPHRRRVGIGRGEIEPEIEPGRHRAIFSGPMSKFAHLLRQRPPMRTSELKGTSGVGPELKRPAQGRSPDLRGRAEVICQGGAKPMADFTLHDLEKRVRARARAPADNSYTRKLLDQGVAGCAKKLGEEAIETVIAAVERRSRAVDRGNRRPHLPSAGRARGARHRAGGGGGRAGRAHAAVGPAGKGVAQGRPRASPGRPAENQDAPPASRARDRGA